MRISAVVGQLSPTWDIARNLDTILCFLREETYPADLVVLPEGMVSGYDDTLSGMDQIDGLELNHALDSIAAEVASRHIHLICGSLQPGDGAWWNTAIYFSPTGNRAIYRKVNLATHERARMSPGSALPVLTMDFPARPLTAGIQLCREIRFPEQWHVLARQGAQLIAYLTYAANASEPADVWRSHLISRAAETQRFVVAANVADPATHCPSMIITPRGEALTESVGGSPQVLRATPDLAETSDWYLSQQRADLVAIQYRDGSGITPATLG
ncbi:MAG: carbon-nitrogen hydrolase family protein [Actinomycetia bacterium]|nr:carbon-nitrogen hydrolase family protein [Actinomycetes bacterium]